MNGSIQLGSGAYSTVKLARNRTNRQKVAVKCIDCSRMSVKEKNMIEKEVAIYLALDHANILRCHDFFKTPKVMYIVLEYIAGGELFDEIVKRSNYTEGAARTLIHTLLTAIQHCHDKHIAHRDLKPENILLLSHTDDSSIKLADFGFAVVCSDNSLTDACGSAYYVAPEILERQPYGLKVDLWSIGIIAYMLLGGTPPFRHPKTSLLFEQIKTGKYEYPTPAWKDISPLAKDFIDHLLVLDATKRYSATEALAHPWVSVIFDGCDIVQCGVYVLLSVCRPYHVRIPFSSCPYFTAVLDAHRGYTATDTPDHYSGQYEEVPGTREVPCGWQGCISIKSPQWISHQ